MVVVIVVVVEMIHFSTTTTLLLLLRRSLIFATVKCWDGEFSLFSPSVEGNGDENDTAAPDEWANFSRLSLLWRRWQLAVLCQGHRRYGVPSGGFALPFLYEVQCCVMWKVLKMLQLLKTGTSTISTFNTYAADSEQIHDSYGRVTDP